MTNGTFDRSSTRYVGYYNGAPAPPVPPATTTRPGRPSQLWEVLGGVINKYYQAA
jgi:hypothetical protein